jgi:hypothetical protein
MQSKSEPNKSKSSACVSLDGRVLWSGHHPLLVVVIEVEVDP